MSHRVPPFSEDPLRLGAYVPFGLGFNSSRLFLPFSGQSDVQESCWSELATSAGTSLRADTMLYDLLDEDKAQSIHPLAEAQNSWITRLLDVLCSAVSVEDSFIFARSKIYAETSQSDTENTAGSGTQFPTVTLSSSHIGPWDTTDFSVRLEPVTHLEQSLKFPTYIWSDDFKLVLTCPIYSDSVFLTSPTLFAEDFVRAGPEARGILKDDYLPVTGD